MEPSPEPLTPGNPADIRTIPQLDAFPKQKVSESLNLHTFVTILRNSGQMIGFEMKGAYSASCFILFTRGYPQCFEPQLGFSPLHFLPAQ
jgi:hypothetical protein